MNRFIRILAAVMALTLAVLPIMGCDTDVKDPVVTDDSTDGVTTEAPETLGKPGTPTGELAVLQKYWPTDEYDQYAEMRAKLEKWLVDHYVNANNPPFSFMYGGVHSSKFIYDWERETTSSQDEKAKYYVVRYTNPADGFTVWSEFTLFKDYPTLEFTTYAKNGGSKNSKKISSFMGMDMMFSLNSENVTLNTTVGSLDIAGDDIADFTLVTKELDGSEISFTPELTDGRSSEHAWPFFDLLGNDCGLMLGLGWTGNWKAVFSENGKYVRKQGGQNSLMTVVYPDEQIRTPLFSITYFDGDAEYGHNLFRKTVLAHYTPDDGTDNVCKLPVAVTTESYGEDAIIADVTKWLGKLKLDTVWTDAAWFGNVDTDKNGWATQTGNWWINTRRFPSGSLKKLTDFLHQNQKKYVLWFEIERVAAGTQFANEHPDLLYKKPIVGSYILKLSDDRAYQWAYDYLSGMIRDNGLDIYRIDMNSPGYAQAWAANDEKDRAGMTEMRYIENQYRLYDALLAEFPGLMIDNCASGGKRIDLEMLKRSVVLHRSDYTCVPYATTGERGTWCWEGIQYQNQTLSYWLPIHASSVGYPVQVFQTAYGARSLLAPGTSLGIQLGYAADDERAQRLSAELSDLRGLFLGDFYQLLPPDYEMNSRQAFMYVRDDIDEAVLLCYTRGEFKGKLSYTQKLKGLEENRYYVVVNRDTPDDLSQIFTGKQLMEQGITFVAPPGSAKCFVITAI